MRSCGAACGGGFDNGGKDVTRKRYRKLCRALNVAIGRPEFSRLSDKLRIMPGARVSYAELWEPFRRVSAAIGRGKMPADKEERRGG